MSPAGAVGRSVPWDAGRSAGVQSWQDYAVVRSRAAGHGKMLAKCVPRRPTVARYRRGAFSGGDPWQLFRFMRSRRGLGREKRQFAATYRRHVSKMSWLRQDIRAMHPKSPANGRSRMHRAKILPRRGHFRCAGPSNHARRADLATPRRRRTAPGRQADAICRSPSGTRGTSEMPQLQPRPWRPPHGIRGIGDPETAALPSTAERISSSLQRNFALLHRKRAPTIHIYPPYPWRSFPADTPRPAAFPCHPGECRSAPCACRGALGRIRLPSALRQCEKHGNL